MEIILSVVGVWIAWITYRKTFPSKSPELLEEKANFLGSYRATQRLSLEVQNLVQHYIDMGHGDDFMYPSCTFSQFIVLTKQEFDKSLSDKLYNDLSKANLTKSNIATMLRMIETQNSALTELRNQMLLLNLNSPA